LILLCLDLTPGRDMGWQLDWPEGCL